MEDIVYYTTIISVLIPVTLTAVKPFPFQVSATRNAKERGWTIFPIIFTRVFPYLTIYTQIWIIIAMTNINPLTMFIAQSMSWFVFFLYHGFNIMRPMSLTYHPEEFVKEVVSWKPPFSKNIVIWFGLHFQHSIFPFYLHYLTRRYELDYTKQPKYIICSTIAVLFYLIWHLFCWSVQGIPAYPFLQHYRENGYEMVFYFKSSVLMITINFVLASMWLELLFYYAGIVTMIYSLS